MAKHPAEAGERLITQRSLVQIQPPQPHDFLAGPGQTLVRASVFVRED